MGKKQQLTYEGLIIKGTEFPRIRKKYKKEEEGGSRIKVMLFTKDLNHIGLTLNMKLALDV